MAETNKKKYKFGTSELDLDKYILNLRNNVESYVSDRIKNGGWSSGLAQEFRNAHDRYIGALQKLYDNDDDRIFTDDHGYIHDNLGELNDSDLDDFLYNDKGEQLSREDFDALKKRKLKGYTDFLASKQWAKYAHIIGKMLASKNTPEVDNTEAYDRTKHGWVNWWRTVKNLDGGTNLAPYLNMDAVGENGKRARTNRAKAAASFVQEYRDWLKGKNLNYDKYVIDYNTLDSRLAALQLKWGDGTWDDNDLTAAALAGIDNSWAEGFFSEDENPNLTPSDKAKKEAEAKAVEDKAKKEQEDKDWEEWFNVHYNNYVANSGNYNDDNEYYYGQLPEQSMDEIRESFAKGTNFNDHINNYLKNPFNNTDTRALNMIIKSGYALQLLDGSYYIPLDSDEQRGMGLVYNPTTGKMKYTFIGNITPVWVRMKNKRDIERGAIKRSALYREEGGVIESMQIGGNFDFNTYMAQDRIQGIKDRALANGRTAKLQEAGERYVNSDNASAQNPDAGFTKVELTRLASIGGDIASMIIGIAGGNIASSIVGAASTSANLAADIADDSTSAWDTFKNAALGYGMDLVGAIPVFGATGKMYKIAKNALKLAPKAMLAFGTGSAIINAPQYYDSWKKLVDKNGKVTVDDWRNIAASIQLLVGGTAAVARQRAVSKAANTDTVAMDFIDGTGNKQTRLFIGDDAKEIRNAKGNLEALKKATVGKFEDIKDFKLDITGQKEGIPLFGKKWGSSEGTANVYDVFNGRKGKYIERGLKWYSLTPDEVAPNIRPTRRTLESVKNIREKWEMRQNSRAINDAIKARDRSNAAESARLARLTAAESDLANKQTALEAYNAGKPAQTSAEIKDMVQRIRQEQLNGTYSKKLADLIRRSKMLDEVDDTGNVIRQGTISQARIRLINERKAANIRVNNALAAYDAKSNKTNELALKKELDARAVLDKKLKNLNIGETKLKIDFESTKAYLTKNDPSQLKGMGSKYTTARNYERGRAALETEINNAQSLIARLKNFSRKHTKEYEALKTKVGDGTLTYTAPGTTTKEVKAFKDIVAKYNLFRKGGKFLSGGAVSNVTGDNDWYGIIYSSPKMKSWLAGFNTTNYLDFNNLLDSWSENLKNTGYSLSNNNNNRTAAYNQGVKDRLGKWQSLGLNQGFVNAYKSNRLHQSGTTGDSAAGNWQDGYFGLLESMRHGGTELGWKNHESELAALLKQFLKNGLEYYNDNGIFKLRPVSNENTISIKKLPLQGQSVTKFDDDSTIKNNSIQNNWRLNLFNNIESFYLNPDTIANVRLWLSDWYNKRISNIERDRLRNIYLKNPLELHRYVTGDLRAIEQGQNSAAKLNHMASRPLTSDGALQTAAQFDSAVKGLEFINTGLATDDAVNKQSNELALAQEFKNAENIHNTAEFNRESLVNLARELKQVDEMELSKKHLNHDTRLLQIEFEKRQELEEQLPIIKNLLDKFALSDIHEYITNNYAMLDGVLSEDERALWKKVMIDNEVTPAALRNTPEYLKLVNIQKRLSLAELDLIALYYKVNPSKWHNIRTYLNMASFSEWKPNQDNLSLPEWFLLYKNGDKIKLLRLRNKSKDHDRFHKNILKNIDRHEKSLDRLAKYSKKRVNK